MNRLYFDIETVPAFELDDPFLEKWVPRGGKPYEEKLIDPDFSKIICIGYYPLEIFGHGDIGLQIMGLDEFKEITLLSAFWKRIDKQLISFNGKGFDLPVIIRRSQLLGLGGMIPPNIDDYLNIYKTDYHIDVMQKLGFNKKWRSQEFYMELFDSKTKPFGGGEYIKGWYDSGDWLAIRQHCEADIKGLIELCGKAGI